MPISEEERKHKAREAPDAPVSEDEKVEEASEESFPASDPPSYTRTPRGKKELEHSEDVTEVEEEEEDEYEKKGGERQRDERPSRGGERGPWHPSTDPSEREETE